MMRRLLRRRQVHIFLFVALVLLVACDNDRNDRTPPEPDTAGARGAAVPTFTPTPSAPPTFTPTPTPTPTFTPYVTPAPEDRLVAAARLHRIGDYTQEQWTLLALLADPGASDVERLNARYPLARSYLAEGNYAQALDALETFQLEAVTLPADDPRRSNAVFLRGEALAGLGRAAEAVAAYSAFLEEHPFLAEVVEEIIAETWRAAGNRTKAAEAYRRAADAAGTRSERARLLEQLAGILEADERWADAAFVYDEILTFSVNAGYRVGILRRAGDAYAAAGEETAAVARWRLALDEQPTSKAAYEALIRLIDREEPVDLFLRGEIDRGAEAYAPALSAFERFLRESPDDPRAGRAWLEIGQSHLGLGNWEPARRAFDRVVADYADCSCFGQAWLERARLEILRGDDTAGRRIYRTFAREHADDPLAPEALWRSALSALAADSETEAAADILALVDGFPHSPRAPDGLSVLGIGAFANGLYAQAVQSFQRLQESYPGVRPAATTYWLGRSLYARGQVEQARTRWQRLVEDEPDTYYGVLAALALAHGDGHARHIFSGVDAVAGPVSTLAGDDGSRSFAEQWLSEWTGVPVAELGVLPLQVAADPDLQGGRLLLDVGRRGEALKLLERVFRRYRGDPATLYALALLFEELGTYRLSVNSAVWLLGLSPAKLVEDTPAYLQRMAYPRHFAALVEAEARTYAIDPLLLFSLIRQESVFEPDARSYAAAQGLAQIIPTTGAEIARRLGYPNYANDLLYRPFVNVRFGAFYLAWVRDFVGGSTAAALAGYNAGPGNAGRWLERTAPDETLFVELITQGEPRVYVQKILSHYYHYNRLYRER